MSKRIHTVIKKKETHCQGWTHTLIKQRNPVSWMGIYSNKEIQCQGWTHALIKKKETQCQGRTHTVIKINSMSMMDTYSNKEK